MAIPPGPGSEDPYTEYAKQLDLIVNELSQRGNQWLPDSSTDRLLAQVDWTLERAENSDTKKQLARCKANILRASLGLRIINNNNINNQQKRKNIETQTELSELYDDDDVDIDDVCEDDEEFDEEEVDELGDESLEADLLPNNNNHNQNSQNNNNTNNNNLQEARSEHSINNGDKVENDRRSLVTNRPIKGEILDSPPNHNNDDANEDDDDRFVPISLSHLDEYSSSSSTSHPNSNQPNNHHLNIPFHNGQQQQQQQQSMRSLEYLSRNPRLESVPVSSSRNPESRRYKCPYCPAHYGTNGNMNRHVRDCHIGVRPHHCPFCSSRFKHKFHMDRHLRHVHSGRGNFRCAQCPNATFRTRHHLHLHEKTHLIT